MNARNSSTSKKRNQHDKFLESRVLMNSNSLNPLSKHISSKLDLIKQEISRQFHEKFPNERKRVLSGKKTSSTPKIKLQKYLQNESINKKLNFGDLAPTVPNAKEKISYSNATQMQSENQNFRERYYELQDKLMDERKKSIDDFQKLTKMKQVFLDFLQQPNTTTFQSLKQYFPTERQSKIIEKFINMNEDVEYAQKVLTQLLSIVQAEDIETLIKQLKSRQTGYKSLSQCTFRIIELETANNKLVQQSQAQIEKTINQYREREEELKNQLQEKMLHVHSIIESTKRQQQQSFRKMIVNLISNINKLISKKQNQDDLLKQKRKSSNFMYATFDKVGKDSSSSKKRALSASSIIENQDNIEKMLEQLMDIVTEMQSNLEDIQKQAEQNAQKLNISKQDMNRLQKLIESVSQQTEVDRIKLIQHFQNVISEMKGFFEKQKQQLQAHCNFESQKLKTANVLVSEMSNKLQLFEQRQAQEKKECNKKQKIINKIIKTVCEATGQDLKIFGIYVSNDQELHSQLQAEVEEIVINKIQMLLNKHLLLLKENLQSAQNMILWHQKELEIKENLLKQFEFNLKKLVEDAEISQENQKKLLFQRDEYKYLLNNLRQNIRQLKIQHSEQIKKVQLQKDREYLHSNKDILEENKRLNENINKLQTSINEMSDQIKAESASHVFYRKKSEQFQATIIDLRKKLVASEAQTQKYKNHLSQIQISFKQVQNLSEINSHKIIDLEEENKNVLNEAAQLREKVKNLQTSVETKDQNYSKLQYSFDELKKRYDTSQRNKEDLENQNSQLRLKSLQILEEVRERDGRLKKLEFETATLTKQNKKLMEQVNQLTKRLLSYAGQKQIVNKSKNQIRNEMNEKIKNQLKKLKDFFLKVKLFVKQYIEQCKNSINLQLIQMRDQINSQLSQNEKQQKRTNTKEHKNYELLLKEQVKNQRLNKKIELANKTLKFVQNDVSSFKQYCKYIKNEFIYQIGHVSELISSPQDLLIKQSRNLESNYEKLLKINLKFSSLKNQNEEMKQIIEKSMKILLSQFIGLINQKNGNKPDKDLEQQNEDDLHKYLFQKQNSKEENEDQLLSNHDEMSPQFVKIARESIQDKEESQKFDRVKENSNSNSQKQNQIDNKNKKQDEEESVDGEQNLINSERCQDKMKKGKNSSLIQKQDDKLRWSGLSTQNQQIRRVKKILQSLKYHDMQQLKIPYFENIKNEYMEVKKKLMAKNLALDISAVSFRHNSISSPSSVSFSKDFLFDKRFNTQPNQQPTGIQLKETNRSQHKFDRNIENIRKQNEELRQQLQQLDEQIKIYEYRQQQYKTTISQLDKQKTSLQNQASQQMKQKLFLKFITDLCKQNWKEVESSCKIILKLLGISNQQINEKMNEIKLFISKYQKKGSSSFMSSLFNKNNKG